VPARRGQDLVAHHDLDNAGGVPQIQERHPAVVPAAGDPARQDDGSSDVLGPERAGIVVAHHSVEFLPQVSRRKVGLTSEPPLVPVYLFIRVPERRTDKNRLHVDLVAPDPQEQVARALSLGARRVQDFNEYGHQWTTLADPEGNLFDIGGTS